MLKYNVEPEVPNLQQKFVLVTGCDSGLGKLLALELIAQKIPTIACCQTEAGCENLTSDARNLNPNCHFWTFTFDVTRTEDAEQLEEKVSAIVGKSGLWSIVCNAGVLGSPVPDDWLSVRDYEPTIAVNLLGTIRTCQTFKKLLRTAKGRIVIVSSCLGQAVMPYTGPYTVAKFAVEGYADTIRNELQPQGVTVHTIIPGYYATNLTNSDFIGETISKCWDRAPKDAVSTYRQEYFENYRMAIMSNLMSLCEKDCSAVINTFMHAITSRHPNRRYRIGRDAFGMLILSLVPAFIQGIIQNKLKQNIQPSMYS